VRGDDAGDNEKQWSEEHPLIITTRSSGVTVGVTLGEGSRTVGRWGAAGFRRGRDEVFHRVVGSPGPHDAEREVQPPTERRQEPDSSDGYYVA
jgi:ribosomal protein L3